MINRRTHDQYLAPTYFFSLVMIWACASGANQVNAQSTTATQQAACDQPAFFTVLESATSGAKSYAPNARAVWLNRRLIKWPGIESSGNFRLYYSARGKIVAAPNTLVTGADGAIPLDVFTGSAPADAALRFKYLAAGPLLALREADLVEIKERHTQQLVLVKEHSDGKVVDATHVQIAGALDDLYRAAGGTEYLGVTVTAKGTQFKLWAPTARRVAVCIYDTGEGVAREIQELQTDAATGTWSYLQTRDLTGKTYTYFVDVHVPGVGLVRNRVTDPYSISLTTDSTRSYIDDLNNPRLKPPGWDAPRAPSRVKSPTDMVIYELHVRDFSINDPSVPAQHRGKYTAFTQFGSRGMKHLKALSNAGMTDIHLLPVFDLATVPETVCVTPSFASVDPSPDGEAIQAAVMAVKERDCFNWGYDPLHYTAPEGSFASNAADGARRVIEFRQMVAALHKLGLRIGMDVVYNHTSASGQHEKSVLDRIVPGYYHRLNAKGEVEKSTCCDNTATENMMMAKLMVDSVLTWAREYKIDSFRFDLMGHQPRAVMEDLKARLKAAMGRDVHLIGEGWNFAEVADGTRFVQASQLSLNGSGIGTFSDRARDAIRGGGAADSGESMIKKQGYINGLGYDRNALANADAGAELLRAADMVRVGLAGSIRDYPLKTYRDETLPLHRIDYAGQPAGYASAPGEVVNYVENHDNQTLFDINVYKLPTSTSREDRARVQTLGLAINAFSQGVAYFHAGGELLRSKSLDRNSYDSGDWFNRIDWSGADNYFATGAPPKGDNGGDYALIKPLLANAAIKPTPADIVWTRRAFEDLLKIRASTPLFRLPTSTEIISRLTFHNTGSQQTPTLIAAHLDGAGYPGAEFREVAYFINVDKSVQEIRIEKMAGKKFTLHPVHKHSGAADQRIPREAKFESVGGIFRIPARSAVVFVVQ